jgi:hypothetical protein
MSVEKRWIILTPGGGHVSIGRHTDPSEAEIETASGKLRQAGTGGWLAVMEDGCFARGDRGAEVPVRQHHDTTLPPVPFGGGRHAPSG